MTDIFNPPDPVLGTSPTGHTSTSATRAYRALALTPDTARPMFIDVIGAVALGLLAVLGFKPTFGGILWLSLGLIGIVAGVIVAYIGTQTKLSPLSTVIATVAVFIVAGGQSVPNTAIAGLLPGPGTPAALFDGITHGWARLLTTVPPVGNIDHVGAIVYLGGYVAGCGGLNLARRTRSAWLPVVPALVVTFAAILVGTTSPATTFASGAGVAMVILAWTSLRGARTRPRVHVVGANVLTRRLTGIAFLFVIFAGGVLVAPAVPFAGPSQRYVLRQHTEPPFDPNNYPSPLVGYRAWRLQAKGQDPYNSSDVKTPIMTVSGLPTDAPIRIAVMDVYDGNSWLVGGPSNGQDATGSGQFVRVGSTLSAGANRTPGEASAVTSGPAKSASLSMAIGDYKDVWIPDVAGIKSLRFTGAGRKELAQNLRFNQATESAAVVSEVGNGTEVHETADIPLASYVGGHERSKIVGAAPVDAAVTLPTPADNSKGDIGRAASAIVGGTTGAYAKAARLETALTKTGQSWYSDGLDTKNSNPATKFQSGHDLLQLKTFLSARNPMDAAIPMYIGNAERYAAAMAAMARFEGLPARVVLGFRQKISGQTAAKRDGKTVTFIANDADAWVEIAFKGVGWVAFYPTPPRDNTNAPNVTQPTQSLKTADAQAQPPVTPPQAATNLQDQVKRNTNKAKVAGAPFHIPEWVWLILKIIFYPLILIAAIVGAITGYKRWRCTRRRTRGTPVDRVTGAWAEMLDQLRDLGTTVPHKGTRLEVASGVPDDAWEQMHGFAAGIDAAMFGPDDPNDESVASLWKFVEAERSKLLGSLERKRRWLVQLNLSSLWPWR